MIPKIIHYCWFGGNEKPKLFKKCYKSWKKYCPDYEIIEWNESNFDLSVCPLYVRQAYEAKKWAFVTDYVRLKVVFENGGIYLDTDVELKKSFDELLNYDAFFGFENKEYIATGLGFGAKKKVSILGELMKKYDNVTFVKEDGTYDLTTCPIRDTRVFVRRGLILDGTKQVIDNGVLVLPSEYLCPLDYNTGKKNVTTKTIAIHWFNASWFSNDDIQKRRAILKRSRENKRREKLDMIKHIPNKVLQNIIGNTLYEKLKKAIKKGYID